MGSNPNGAGREVWAQPLLKREMRLGVGFELGAGDETWVGPFLELEKRHGLSTLLELVGRRGLGPSSSRKGCTG